MTVSLRPESQADAPFVRDLVMSTVASELGASTWPEPMRSQLLGVQYAGRRHSGDATGVIVERDGEPVGWAALSHAESETWLIEIMIAEGCRGQGVGTRAIQTIQRNAAEAGKPLRLNVNVTNRNAIRLYLNLGFVRTGGNAVQDSMEYFFTDT